MYLFLSEQLAWKENNNKKIKHHLIVGAALSGKKKLVQPILTIYRTAIKKKRSKQTQVFVSLVKKDERRKSQVSYQHGRPAEGSWSKPSPLLTINYNKNNLSRPVEHWTPGSLCVCCVQITILHSESGRSAQFNDEL